MIQHVHVLPDGNDDAKFIGVYRSVESAREAIDRLKSQPSSREFPRIIDPLVDDDRSGFHINPYELGKDHWSEGFATVPA